MQASRESAPKQIEIEILPLVIVTQAFAIRPSSLPDIRDFVRRRLAPTTLAEDDVRTLCDRVAEVLLDVAGADGTIQVSLRIFTGYAEVDVLFAESTAEPERDAPIAPADDQPRPARPPAAVSFADWLAGALRREGLTMEAAARELSVSAKTVSRWAAGTTEPRLRDLARIREIFGDLPLL
jgi:hypothetical protein